MIKMRQKKANILTENLVFIIITLLFIATLFGFVSKSSSKLGLVEEAYAKKIALVLDSARPGTTIILDVGELLEKKDVDIANENVVVVNGNTVTVQLTKDSGHSYSFFTNVDVEINTYEDTSLHIIIK
jgi:hypothetical protein